MVKQYNIIPHGNITNNNGVLSGFSVSSYATIPLNFNPVQRPFEVVFKFVGTNGVIWDVGDWTTARGHIEFEISQSKLYAEFARTSGSSVVIWAIEGSTTLSSNVDYWVKLTYDGVNTYSLYLSTDGITWNAEGTATSNDFLGDGSTQYNLIGCQVTNGTIEYIFDGSIDINGSYIKINDNIWWQGVSDVTRIQLRHDTLDNWSAINPILLEGEVGLELNTGKQKIGDGVTAWNNLAYDYGSTAVQSSELDDYQEKLVSSTNIKTVNNTSLLGSGNIDTSEIFIAEYGVTSFADIETAYNAGKVIFCNIGDAIPGQEGFIARLEAYDSTIRRFEFSCIYNNIIYKYRRFSGLWDNSSSTVITTDTPYVIDTYSNGKSGWRKWSDGYYEEWGYWNYNTSINGGRSAVTTITLLNSFNNSDYNVTIACRYSNSNSALGEELKVYSVTNSTFALEMYNRNSNTASGTGVGIDWKACGYITSN